MSRPFSEVDDDVKEYVKSDVEETFDRLAASKIQRIERRYDGYLVEIHDRKNRRVITIEVDENP